MCRTLIRLVLLATLALPALANEPLRVALVGDYRPLTAREPGEGQDGFEQALLKQWAAAMGRPLLLVSVEEADLRIGSLEEGEVYYRTQAAALTASEDGITSWHELEGHSFCVVAGSPYATSVAERYGALPKTYPSAAHALVGLRRGECRAVIEDQRLLRDIARLPEWQRYSRLLMVMPDIGLTLRAQAREPQLQTALRSVLRQQRPADLTQNWVNEVAFQAYVLDTTLDCH